MSDIPPDTVKDKNSRLNVIVFALATSVVCSLLITAAAVGLKDLQTANRQLDKKSNILKAVHLVGAEKPSEETINRLYNQSIKEILVNRQGKIVEKSAADGLQLYLFQQEDTIKGYIIPINTRGLWGKIQGYLAFENDGMTVSGFSVFSHSETPGLGGEIESTWFRKNFQGKKIFNAENKFVSVKIAKGKAANLPEEKQPHHVDGISGATLTGRYLSKGIKTTLVKYDSVSVTFRQNRFPQKTDTP